MIRNYKLSRVELIFPIRPSPKGLILGVVNAHVEGEAEPVSIGISRMPGEHHQLLVTLNLASFGVPSPLWSPELRGQVQEAVTRELIAMGIEP